MGDIHEAARAPKPRGEDARRVKRPWIPPFFIFPSGSLDAVLQKVLDELLRVFTQAERGFILFRDELTDTLGLKASSFRRAELRHRTERPAGTGSGCDVPDPS